MLHQTPVHLRSVMLRRDGAPFPGRFPFTVPAIQTLDVLNFTAPVTFLVGENGSGKSTLLEAIAAAAGITTAGSAAVASDPSLAAARLLGNHLRLTWQRRGRRGFFLRAEDFFGYVKGLSTTRAELESDLRSLDREYEGRSDLSLNLARLPYLNELRSVDTRYGGDLDSFSHGESFLRFFQARFVPDGLYLLDEPEAPLSPARQLTLLSMMKKMVTQNTQFIIATHSPILMAFPGAAILSFDASPIRPVPYESLDHVTITRDFLNNPAQYLQHLDAEEDSA